MQCLEVQPVAAVCSTPSCNGFSMGRYFCNICKFFDNDNRSVYCILNIVLDAVIAVVENLNSSRPFFRLSFC